MNIINCCLLYTSDFAVAEGDEPVKVYEYCNIHGLWAAEL